MAEIFIPRPKQKVSGGGGGKFRGLAQLAGLGAGIALAAPTGGASLASVGGAGALLGAAGAGAGLGGLLSDVVDPAKQQQVDQGAPQAGVDPAISRRAPQPVQQDINPLQAQAQIVDQGLQELQRQPPEVQQQYGPRLIMARRQIGGLLNG